MSYRLNCLFRMFRYVKDWCRSCCFFRSCFLNYNRYPLIWTTAATSRFELGCFHLVIDLSWLVVILLSWMFLTDIIVLLIDNWTWVVMFVSTKFTHIIQRMKVLIIEMCNKFLYCWPCVCHVHCTIPCTSLSSWVLCMYWHLLLIIISISMLAIIKDNLTTTTHVNTHLRLPSDHQQQ